MPLTDYKDKNFDIDLNVGGTQSNTVVGDAIHSSNKLMTILGKTNLALMQHHNYSLSDLDNMIPWEREIYVTLLVQILDDEKKIMDQQNRSMR